MTRCMMRLDDKLAALDNHAARRMHVSEWQHLRALAAAEGDSVIVAECDYRIAKLTARPDGDFGCAHARLAAKLADAKRLGLEACGIADSAVQVIDDEAIDDDSESPRVKRDLRRLRAALEAL